MRKNLIFLAVVTTLPKLRVGIFARFFSVAMHNTHNTFISLSSVEATKIEFNLAVTRWVSEEPEKAAENETEKVGDFVTVSFRQKKRSRGGIEGFPRMNSFFWEIKKGRLEKICCW